eukprot:c3192_g1_i1.p1 GENE.c3192_g1_i1~~c3192_g1_i1.p1  ORF type:complete len:206 (-),score=33.16 c3192_g1_i1:62-679(-)
MFAKGTTSIRGMTREQISSALARMGFSTDRARRASEAAENIDDALDQAMVMSGVENRRGSVAMAKCGSCGNLFPYSHGVTIAQCPTCRALNSLGGSSQDMRVRPEEEMLMAMQRTAETRQEIADNSLFDEMRNLKQELRGDTPRDGNTTAVHIDQIQRLLQELENLANMEVDRVEVNRSSTLQKPAKGKEDEILDLLRGTDEGDD